MSLIGLIKQGDIIGAVKKVISLAEGGFKTLEEEFPPLAAFVDQFESDFGKAALVTGQAFVADIKAGSSTLPDAAAALLKQLADQALDTAGHDALAVASNALGVLVRSPLVEAAPQPAPTSAPSDTAE